MSRRKKFRVGSLEVLGVSLLLAGALACASARAERTHREPTSYRWLEEVEAPEALAWVEERNAKTVATLASSDRFHTFEAELRTILDSDERIPYVRSAAGRYYNFWRDAEHPRGIWRRTTPAQYAQADPDWEVVLDLDALAAADGESWVWKGANTLPPKHERALVSLSRGGGDAVVVREFDLVSKSFVAGGFELPEAKSRVSWRDGDAVFVGTDFGPGSLTSSGYPRTARLWRRGTPLAEAAVVFEGEESDVSVGAYHDATPGFERDFVQRGKSFYSTELYLLRDGALVRVEKPDDAGASTWREWLLLTLRSDYELDGTTYPSGAVLAARFEHWLAGERAIEVIYTPTERSSLAGMTPTRHHVIVNELDDVKNRLWVLTPGADGFKRAPLEGLPALGSVRVSAVDADESDEYFGYATGYLTPTTLLHGTLGAGPPTPLKQLPAQFDTAGLQVTQHQARSADGTMIPYFEVGPEQQDGPRPTLLYGYGGFRISMLPSYSAGTGRLWLDHGGVYVVANIRGGGEFGPRWHQAALKEHRLRAYEDFAAVARDLIARGVTTTPQLGIQGGSNGGLLVGNMFTLFPDLFGAVVCQVPLLDMRRYHLLLAGASWMAEYGDPDDPEQWAFMRTFSPYHNVRADVHYPPILFTTSTRDDRVHPGHARKMVARMLEQGHDVRYYENTEGGHAGAANNAQRAFMSALAYEFLWEQLGG